MRVYELALVMRSSLSEAERKKLMDSIKDWIKDVKVVKEDAVGQKALSYPIKKESSGFYHFLSLEAETIPSDLEKRLLANEQVLRHLLIRRK